MQRWSLPLDEEQVAEVAGKVEEGGTVIYPTETAYGLGTNALDPKAVESIYRIKNRPKRKRLTCIVSDLTMAQHYSHLNEKEKQLVRQLMPGPITLLAEKKSNVPDVLNDKFAFRISSHPVARGISRQADVPLVATSANLAGAATPYSPRQVGEEVWGQVDYLLDAGELEEQEPSTVVNLCADGINIIREGPVTIRQIRAVLTESGRHD